MRWIVLLLLLCVGCGSYGARYHNKLLYTPIKSEYLNLPQVKKRATVEFSEDKSHGEFIGVVYASSLKKARKIAARVGATHIVEVHRSSQVVTSSVVSTMSGVSIFRHKTLNHLVFLAFRDSLVTKEVRSDCSNFRAPWDTKPWCDISN